MFLHSMLANLNAVWEEDTGAVTLEYLLLGALVAAGGVTGMSAMSDAINTEMRDFGQSVRQLRQAYTPSMAGTPNGAVPGLRNMTAYQPAVIDGSQPVMCTEGTCDFGCP